jgi:hypothetical protein
MNLTRRQLVVGAAAASAAAKASAQSGTTATGTTAAGAPSVADFARQARESVQQNGDKLAKFVIPMSTEPAFQFKA